jgi:hypothetical protein
MILIYVNIFFIMYELINFEIFIINDKIQIKQNQLKRYS